MLLIETVSSDTTNIITEAIGEGKDKKYYIEGIFLQSNIENGNRRIYPEEVMDREVLSHIEQKVNKHRSVGELEHPDEERNQSINLRFVSHKIISLTKSGTNWLGKAEITKGTAMGSIAAGLMESGVVLGVSSRAKGSLKKQTNGVSIVQNDFRLITPADIVSDPSAPDALTTSIMENKEWIFENGALTEKNIDEIKYMVNKQCRNNILDESKIYAYITNLIKNGEYK